MPPPTLGYWDIRGLAEPIRYIQYYVGEKFVDKIYNFGPAPEYSKHEWLNDKFSLKLSLPNLPYYVCGNVRLTQSSAILRHLSRKFGLGAKSEGEHQILDMIEGHLVDMRLGLILISYNSEFENLKHDYLHNLKEKLKLLSDFLKDNKWFVGDRITYVDFLAYDCLDFQRVLQEDCLNPFSNLVEYMHRFENLQGIKLYLKSDDFRKKPIFPPFFAFEGRRPSISPEKESKKEPL